MFNSNSKFNSNRDALSTPLPNNLQKAILAIQKGEPILLTDEINRENEADLVVAAEKLTVETMALFIRECSGIVCLCLTDDQLKKLNLPSMVEENTSKYGTAFTVSIEAKEGITTGVSAADRVQTIKTAIADNAKPTDLARPGHVFPLRADSGGVLKRRGHTEGSVDLMILAGLKPAAVLCELMNADGTMAKGEQVTVFANSYKNKEGKLSPIPIIAITDIVDYLQAHIIS